MDMNRNAAYATTPRPGVTRWGVIILTVCLLALFALPAQARSWRISRFNSTIGVMDNGTMVVTEDLHLVFIGSFQGIYRTIPIDYPGPDGTNYRLMLDIDKVTDGDGNPLRYESTTRGAYRRLKIYVPGASDTDRTVKIIYTVRNGVRFFHDHDELYWNVTGNDWPVPIDNASAFVSFPDNAAGSLRAQAFTGVYGSTSQEATANVQGSNVSFETTNPLPLRGGLTIDVYLPKGILKQPGLLTRIGWFLAGNLIVLLPVFAFVVMFGMWWLKGRDPDPGMSVAPLYEPPKGMTPAEAGSFIDDSVDPRDITSTIIDLAVRGYLKIEEKSEKVLFFNSKEYVFHLLKPQAQWNDLASHEQEILRNMFTAGEDLTTLSSLKNRFYMALPSVKKEILSELKDKGLYRVDPDSANGYRLVAVLLIAIPFLLLQMSGKYQFFQAPMVAVFSILLALAIVFLIGRYMTAKTLRGARTLVGVLGFKEFLTRVDGDRLKKMPPDTFEKYLPYAMAFGVEKHWANAFQGIIQNPPTWYVGPAPMMGVWNPIFFAGSMHSLTSSTYEAFASAPRASSTGSGFGGGGFGGGGGFSGGGFGGGGGGAF